MCLMFGRGCVLDMVVPCMRLYARKCQPHQGCCCSQTRTTIFCATFEPVVWCPCTQDYNKSITQTTRLHTRTHTQTHNDKGLPALLIVITSLHPHPHQHPHPHPHPHPYPNSYTLTTPSTPTPTPTPTPTHPCLPAAN